MGHSDMHYNSTSDIERHAPVLEQYNPLTAPFRIGICMPIYLDGESGMPTRNVVLTNYQASFVERLVSTGRYQNASEVLREGLRMVEQREAEDASRLEALRNAVKVGIADFEQGRFTSFETGAQLREHMAAVASKAIAGV